ncbi:MAG TPA: SDR family NAD(P)-dependent oxidoreductase [Dehalococcoidia bacterium]|nr:SDR family NAD(P)-dependent oxidoreductase [Dehalococcoidia bacterium]
MAGRLEGKVAIVTGSGRGIGRGIAKLMASEGARVIVNDPGVNVDGTGHDGGPADEVVGEIKKAGGEATADYTAVGTLEAGEQLIRHALDAYGRLDILVNNAGILRDRMVFNMSEEEWDAVLRVHLSGQFGTIKPASVLFRQQRSGRIVNFSSTSGLIGNAGQANYGAAKAGVAGLTRVVARDLGRYGATCNAIAPGASTRMTASVPDSARELRARAGIAGAAGAAPAAGQAQAAPAPRPAANPLAALREPEYVAPMVAYLATDHAWNINGQVFGVSGGTISLLHHPTPQRTIFKPGMWTLDELEAIVPSQLMQGYTNPAPPPPDLPVAGRNA